MSSRRAELFELANSDNRFAPEAYEFLCHALGYTQKAMATSKRTPAGHHGTGGVPKHVTGQEFLEGVRQFALEQFGMMASVVFQMWGIRSTSDIGTLVFKLVDAGIWTKSQSDRPEDFKDYYDFEQVFVLDYQFKWDED